MKIASSAFEDGSPIPSVHTCDGKERAPPLSWSNVPHDAKSLALIIEDPDAPDPAAPRTLWVHWVLYNIPPHCHGLPEGAHPLPEGTLQGLNSWKRTAYGGPCPPIGRHRYFHRLYALDVVLPDLHRPSHTKLLAAMQGHVIAESSLLGLYQRR